jgi:hypothetical protein
MARARSPEYPAISLKEAIDRVKMVYDRDYQTPLPRQVIAERMGYKGLSGASLPILSALVKYGLLEGRADETQVSDLAVSLIAHAPGTSERMDALKQASVRPELFAELESRFPDGKTSHSTMRSYLLTRKFIPSAADAAIRAYRDTKQLVQAESEGYNEGQSQEPSMAESSSSTRPLPAKSPMLQEVFNLDEGPVTLTFPSALSQESYEDLKAELELFLRRALRRAARAQQSGESSH